MGRRAAAACLLHPSLTGQNDPQILMVQVLRQSREGSGMMRTKASEKPTGMPKEPQPSHRLHFVTEQRAHGPAKKGENEQLGLLRTASRSPANRAFPA